MHQHDANSTMTQTSLALVVAVLVIMQLHVCAWLDTRNGEEPDHEPETTIKENKAIHHQRNKPIMHK